MASISPARPQGIPSHPLYSTPLGPPPGTVVTTSPARADSAPSCGLCEQRDAVYLCEDCDDICMYCVLCEAAIHAEPPKAFHFLVSLDGKPVTAESRDSARAAAGVSMESTPVSASSIVMSDDAPETSPEERKSDEPDAILCLVCSRQPADVFCDVCASPLQCSTCSTAIHSRVDCAFHAVFSLKEGTLSERRPVEIVAPSSPTSPPPAAALSLPPGAIPCGPCKSKAATHFCEDCTVFNVYCESCCHEAHSDRMRRGHKITPITADPAASIDAFSREVVVGDSPGDGVSMEDDEAPMPVRHSPRQSPPHAPRDDSASPARVMQPRVSPAADIGRTTPQRPPQAAARPLRDVPAPFGAVLLAPTAPSPPHAAPPRGLPPMDATKHRTNRPPKALDATARLCEVLQAVPPTPRRSPPPLASNPHASFQRARPGDPVPHGAFDSSLTRFESSELTAAIRAGFKFSEGGFGPVYRCTLRGMKVAIKALAAASEQGDEEFNHEVNFLGRIRHANIVRLLGYGAEGGRGTRPQRWLVYEYMDRGSITALLPDPKFTWLGRINVAIHVADGLLFCHDGKTLGGPIIHLDIKPDNVLMTRTGEVKLGDFGLAKFCPAIARGHQTHVTYNVAVGTQGYMAPEMTTMGFYSEKCDVYSYGVLLLQLATGLEAIFKRASLD